MTTWLRRHALVLLVASIAASTTAWAWRAARLDARHDVEAYFDYRVRDAVARIQQRLLEYEQVLRGTQGLLASAPVSRDTFRQYVASLRIERSFPGIQGVGFSTVVAPGDLARHLAQVRAEGFADYTVWPAGERERYTAIVYLEPFSGRNLRAFGYDMYSEPVRREAMDRAGARDELAISGKVRLVQETDEQPQSGFLMYVPVRARATAGPADLRGDLMGWAYAPFRMNDLMAGTLGELGEDLDVEIFDGDDTSPNGLMFDSLPNHSHADADVGLRSVSSVRLGGHGWTLVVTSLPGLEARLGRGSAGVVLWGGFVASLLLTALTWMVASRHQTLEARVEERTAALAESEEKYRILFNNELAAIGIFDLETKRFIDANPAYETVYGWTTAELTAGMTIHDITVEHAESDASTVRANRDGTIFIPLRWHRKKDGTVFPVEIVGGPYVYRGQRVMFAMSLDISDRLRAEEEAREKTAEIDQFFDHNLDLLCIADQDGRFRRLNPEWARVLGYPLSDLQGARYLDFVHPDDVQATEDAMAQLLRQQAVAGFVNRFRTRDGTYRVLEWRSYPAGRMHYAAARDITEQRRSEAALVESEARFRSLANAAPVLIWISGPDKQCSWFNQVWLDFTGRTMAEEVGDGWADGVHPDDFDRCLQTYAGHFEARALFSMDYRLRRHDGVYRWVHGNGRPRFDERGEFVGYIGSCIDITDQKRLQDELARVTREQAVILEHANVGITFVRDHVQVWANHRMADLLRYPLDAMADRPTSTFFGSQEAYRQLIGEAPPVLAAGRVYRAEIEMRRADDSRFWASIRGKAIEPANAAAGSIWIFEDVTERRSLDAKLRASEEKYAALFRLLPIGVAITDGEGQIVEVNQASERILGLTPSEHLERHFDAPAWDIVRPDGSPMPPDEFASVRAMREAHAVEDIEMGVKRPDDAVAWLLASAMPIPVEGYGVAIVYKDITERKLSEELVRASLREKETLLREIHHRVKNNMQVISSILDLQGQRVDSPEFHDLLLVAQRRVKAMALLHEKLYQARDLSTIDFADYVRLLVQETLVAHGIGPQRVVAHVRAPGLRFDLDTAVPCGLVINELLSNVCKHAFPPPRTGRVDIEIEEQPGQYVVTVRDDGVGLPAGFDLAASPSLGLQLVGVLTRQLRGTFHLSGDGGVTAKVVFPRTDRDA